MSHGGTISESHLMNVSSIHNYFHRKDEDDFMFLSKLVMSTYLLSDPPMGIMSESFSLCAPQRMMERCWFWWCDVWRRVTGVRCHALGHAAQPHQTGTWHQGVAGHQHHHIIRSSGVLLLTSPHLWPVSPDWWMTRSLPQRRTPDTSLCTWPRAPSTLNMAHCRKTAARSWAGLCGDSGQCPHSPPRRHCWGEERRGETNLAWQTGRHHHHHTAHEGDFKCWAWNKMLLHLLLGSCILRCSGHDPSSRANISPVPGRCQW